MCSTPKNKAQDNPTLHGIPEALRRHHLCQQSLSVMTGALHCPQNQMLLRGYQREHEDVPTNQKIEKPTSSNTTVAIIFFKTFLGLAFLFMPNGFQSAGIVGGPAVLGLVYLLELHAMMSLIKCREVLGKEQRFEQLAQVFGSYGQSMTEVLIAMSQFGFCCIWIVNNAQNLQMVLPWMSDNQRLWVTFPFTVPLIWVRRLKSFNATNLIAITMILVTGVYLAVFGAQRFYENGMQPVRLFNIGIPMWMGSCAYVYMGVNIVLPVYESAQDKGMVPVLLSLSTLVVTLLYVLFGLLFYFAFGEEVGSLATLNLPAHSWAGHVFPCLFALAGVFTLPIMFFVPIQMYEARVSWSQHALTRKLQKNAIRTAVLFITMAITTCGGQCLQNWLGLIGGICCATLGLMLPAALHAAICNPNASGLVIDAVTFAVGTLTMVVSTQQALASWK